MMDCQSGTRVNEGEFAEVGEINLQLQGCLIMHGR